LNLIQEDRRVFCKYDRFCKHGPGQTRFTDWPTDESRRTCSAACVISITN
jgi:hypothetical protein